MTMVTEMQEPQSNAKNFILLASEIGALKVGNFKTKAGRPTPYFFNSGNFSDGESLSQLGEFYAHLLMEKYGRAKLEGCVLFGPAYKGIGLVHVIAIWLYINHSINVGVAYNRKEAKNHGEGGHLVGASMNGKDIIIIEDVVTTGGTKIEVLHIIKSAGGKVIGCVVALDRLEQSENPFLTGREEFEKLFGVPMYSIATTRDIIEVLSWPTWENKYAGSIRAIEAYLEKYGPQSGTASA